MFIELTDHLACPSAHEEQFLVLLPERMDHRRVVSGDLGCPVCGRIVRLDAGIADFGDAPPSDGYTTLTAEALSVFFGLSGPGGYLALAGGVTSLAPELAVLVPGVRLVLVNPPSGTEDTELASVLRSPRLPLKTGTMRGIAIGADLAGDPSWIKDGARAVLSGLRMISEGGELPADRIEELGRVGEVWIGTARPLRSSGPSGR